MSGYYILAFAIDKIVSSNSICQLKNQGNCINDIEFISLTELGQQLEHARLDRGETHSQKIFLKTTKNHLAEREMSVGRYWFEEGQIWELSRSALLIKRVQSSLDPDVLFC